MVTYVRWFADVGLADLPSVGGKNASLGEMVRELATQGLRVPNGFAITAQAYRDVLEGSGAWPRLQRALSGLDPHDVDDLARRAREARESLQRWRPRSWPAMPRCATSTAPT
jgi:pyruvate, water dikinase